VLFNLGCEQESDKKCDKDKACCAMKSNKDSSENTLTSSLKAEIMMLHDEVMPQDPYLYQIRTKLEAFSGDVTTLLDSVKLAQKEMNDWMKNYQPSHNSLDTLYFNEELEKVKQVNFLYKAVIESAEKVIVNE
jgi:hypothetical protein